MTVMAFDSAAIQMKVRQSGFTLIEIMVALFIVAVALLAVGQTMRHHTELAASLDQRLKATWVASDQMARLRHQAKAQGIKPGSTNKIVKVGSRKWRYKQVVKKTAVDRVYLVVIEVFDPANDKKEPQASLTSAVSDLKGV